MLGPLQRRGFENQTTAALRPLSVEEIEARGSGAQTLALRVVQHVGSDLRCDVLAEDLHL